MKVGIVGGSIAGCTAAIELLRAGHEVNVLERSRGGLTGRGAGIGTPLETIATLVSRDLIDANTPRFVVSEHPLASREDAKDRYGQRALTLPLNMALINWGDLWRQLRSRVPDSAYDEGTEVTSSRPDGDRIVLTGTAGRSGTYDLVLFADGYQSIGRRALFPDLHPSYRGYVLWRGVLEEEVLERWSTEQAHRGRRLAALGEQMERAMVWGAPDFSTMTESSARAWWEESITFPDEFSYVAAERK